MKLTGTAAERFCRSPDGHIVGALLYGPDGGLLGLMRGELTAAITGGDAMSLVRIEPDQARRDPARLEEAALARGFFTGRQVVLVDGATDGLAGPVRALADRLTPDDAFLLLTSSKATTRSPLVKAFEKEPTLAALGLYPDPPSAEEISRRIAEAGGPDKLDREAAGLLLDLGAAMDPGSFRRCLETLALHSLGAERVTAAHVEAVAPMGAGGDLDALVAAVAGGAPERVGPLIARLMAGGTRPGDAVGAVSRQVRRLLGLSLAPEGAASAVGRLRPPVFGPRRDALLAQCRRWSAPGLETAARLLFDTERRLRGPGSRPDAALTERCLIRIAMMARAGGGGTGRTGQR